MAQGLHGARRPRPVADIAQPALADGETCAKGWLLALVAATPLAALGALPTADLAAEAPALCAAVLRAVGSDRELERLEAGGDLAAPASRAGRLAGAGDAAAVAQAVGLLREGIWDALLDELDRRDGELVAAAAARLAHVCDVVLQAALVAEPGRPRHAARPLTPVPPVGAGATDHADPPPRRGPVGIVGDERSRTEESADRFLGAGPAERPDRPHSESHGVVPPPDAGDGPHADRPGVDSRPEAGERPGGASLGVVPVADGEVVARRGGGGAEPWLDAVAARLARHRDEGRPFAVLAVEVDDAERLLAADADGEALRAIARAEAAVRRTTRTADAVVREHPGRLWIVVEVAGAADARALGERVAEAAADVVLRGAPLTVSIGFATCPEDSTDAASLVAHADEGVFAARAAGVRLA